MRSHYQLKKCRLEMVYGALASIARPACPTLPPERWYLPKVILVDGGATKQFTELGSLAAAGIANKNIRNQA